MLPQLTLLAVAALGIDVGWEPLDGGGVVYIIQIEPDQVDRLKDTDDLLSDMPKDLDVRQVRVTIGNDKLPRKSAKPTTAKSLPKERQLIAEGSIPNPPAKPEYSSAPAAADGPQLIAPTQSEPILDLAKSDSGQPTETAAKETTTLRPIEGRHESRDPEPKDEEDSGLAPGRTEVVVPPVRDELFDTPPSRPLTSRQLDDPRDVQPRRKPIEPTPLSRVPEVDYEAAKPTLPSSFRTAESGMRLTPANDDRVVDRDDSAWGPVVAIFFFLLLSMGANMWLAWIAWEARQRYQVLLDKYRAIGGKPAMELA